MQIAEKFHNDTSARGGRLEVICGPMFSGKTMELLKRVELAKANGRRVVVIKPSIDTHYSENKVVSHNKVEADAVVVGKSNEILEAAQNAEVMAIDEVQFFDAGIVDLCQTLVNRGVRVVVCGLDLDSSGKPFGSMPELLVYADDVVKLHATCSQTGEPARYTYRHSGGNNTVEVGEKNLYMPLSRNAFLKEMNKKPK